MTVDLKLAVAYARVSTKDQERTGHTLPIQSKNMLAYAQGKGLRIVKDFVVAESASKRDRRHYMEMWSFLREHQEVKHVIFEEIDRFTRNDKDKLDLVDNVNNNGYVAHFVMEKLTLDKETSPNDIFLFDILVAKAKNYSGVLSQKVKKGQQGKLEKGGYPGGYPPYGYKKISTKLVPSEPYSLCVKKAFELVEQEHLTLNLLSKRLNLLGFCTRSGKRITQSFIHGILTNRIYSGVVSWKGATFTGDHEPLVSRASFQMANDWLTRKNCTHWITHNFTYRGFMRCGDCGGGVTAETHKGYIYYRCTHYRPCHQRKYTHEETIENEILGVLSNLNIGEEAAEIVKNRIIAKRRDEDGFKRIRLEDLKRQYEQSVTWIDKIYDDRMSGLIDEEMYKRKVSGYKERREEISQSLINYANGGPGTFELSLNVPDLANRAAEIYKKRLPDEKRLLLGILVSNAILTEERVDLTLQTPFAAVAKYRKTRNWSG